MRTIRTKVYQFNELNENAKENAIEWYKKDQEIFLDFFNEDAKEQIENAGFKGNIQIQYDLSYSQGDGLSFSCDYYDKLNELFTEFLGHGKQKTIDCLINNCSFKLKGNNGRYCYASKSDLDFYLDNYYVKSQENIDEIITQVRQKLEDLYIDLCKDLESQGYKEIEYQYSDEYIIENIISNEYEFTAEGNRF
jgi:hypothetical protein